MAPDGEQSEQWRSSIASLQLGDLSIYPPVEKLRRARDHFKSVVTAAEEGRVDLSDAERARDIFLELSRFCNASGPAYVADFRITEDAFSRLADRAPDDTSRRLGSRPDPWTQGVSDAVAATCRQAMDLLKEADGRQVYVEEVRRRTGVSRLEIDEAVDQLVQLKFVDHYGGYPDPRTLFLTPKGRKFLLSGKWL